MQKSAWGYWSGRMWPLFAWRVTVCARASWSTYRKEKPAVVGCKYGLEGGKGGWVGWVVLLLHPRSKVVDDAKHILLHKLVHAAVANPTLTLGRHAMRCCYWTCWR